MPILTANTSAPIAIRNIGDKFLFRNSKAKAIININNIIKFLGLLKSRLFEDNPIPKNRNKDKKIVIRTVPKIEWVNPLWLERRKIPPKKTITKPK